MFWCFFLAPATITGLAAVFIYLGLHDATRVRSWHVTLGVMLLIAVGVFIFIWTFQYAAFVTALTFLPATVVAIIAALWTLWTLKGWRKVAAGVIGILWPVALYLSIILGLELPYESRIHCALKDAADAIERFQAVHKRYPVLTELYPPSLGPLPHITIKNPQCNLGGGTHWLYTHTADHYRLGFWRFITGLELLGPRICLYETETAAVKCQFNNWGPFTPDPAWLKAG